MIGELKIVLITFCYNGQENHAINNALTYGLLLSNESKCYNS